MRSEIWTAEFQNAADALVLARNRDRSGRVNDFEGVIHCEFGMAPLETGISVYRVEFSVGQNNKAKCDPEAQRILDRLMFHNPG